MRESSKTIVLKGRTISGGFAAGRAELRLEDLSTVPLYRLVDEQDVRSEIEMFHRALEAADEKAAADLEWARGSLPEGEAEIFSAQRSILNDPTLVEWVEKRIREDRMNAGAAVRARFDEFRAILEESTSEIIRNRISDVTDAEHVILSHVLGTNRATAEELADDSPVILVTNDPPPSLLARVDPQRVVGILCEQGAGMSHVAVLARTLNLPALAQVEGLLAATRTGDILAINADEGYVTINPTPAELESVRARERARRILFPPQPSDPRAQRVTSDGCRIRLLANVTCQREVAAAAEVDAEGIGLYRTEFLYLSRERSPSEAELVSIYSEAACSFAKDPVDIRLLDVGSDKVLPGMRTSKERNPALGLRSLRFLFENPEILEVQLRAVLQAAADGPLRALLPMVADPSEIRRIRDIAQECHEALRQEGVRHNPDLPIGAMIEHPAGVFLAEEIFAEADFVSVGTNDLIMYVLAADRDAPGIAEYYDPFHPAVIRILERLAQISRERDTALSICGEIAGDPTWTGLLVGLGVSRLSMAPQWIVPVGQVLQNIDSAQWHEVAAEAARMDSAADVRRRVRELQGVS